jgi:hypothetical protein
MGHWWNGTWGRLARLDVFLRIERPRWEVELREGEAEGRSDAGPSIPRPKRTPPSNGHRATSGS